MKHKNRKLTSLFFGLLFILVSTRSDAQFSDKFSDLELTTNPTWQGTVSNFVVNAEAKLQLNDLAAGVSSISNNFEPFPLNNAEWSFWVKQAFSGSGSNYGRIYLASDQADVSGPLNGYFIQFGEAGSNDALALFYQNGTSTTLVCRGTDGLVSGSFEMRVRVTRDAAGLWEIGVDLSGGTQFVLDASGIENTIASTTNFGVLCVYTASNKNKFYYDDLFFGAQTQDLSAPEITEVAILSSTELDVQFNELLDQPSAETAVNYLLNNGLGTPSSATLDGGDPSLVHLTFSTVLTNGTQYNLNVSGIKDIAGNLMQDTTKSILYVVPEPANFRDVVINEFLADPSPVVGLPEAEYIELFNASNKFIDISGWTVSDGSSIGTVAEHVMPPSTFALLVSSSDVGLFSQYENVIPVNSFPALNNGGDLIVLKNASSELMDQLSYDLSWYQNESKQSGGYSLELVNPFLSCSDAKNWLASNHPNGGTPSKENAVFSTVKDTVGPSLTSVFVTGTASLQLVFDKPLDYLLVTKTSVVIEPFIEVASVKSLEPNYADIEVTFNSPLDTGVYYTVYVTGLFDCQGNGQAADSSLGFVIPFSAYSGDFVINEVLFNPYTGGSDYVELVNKTGRVLNLKGWQLANFDEEYGIDNHSTIINSNYAVEAGGYVLITEDTTNVMLHYIQHGIGNFIQADLPSYGNDAGKVFLLKADSTVSEVFAYTEEMHLSLLDDVDGVSLERLDVNREVNDAGNWHSAAETAGFGTPGRVNSQYYPTSGTKGEVSTDPEIFSPDNDGHNDVLNINFAFTEPGNVGTIRIYDANGRPTKELATNELLGASGTFTWDGTTDSGEKARIGMYIIMFESFNSEGKTNRHKLSTVLAGRL
ncbi:lamin tail domain-containing protein [Bacteroidota bacterium]